MALFTLFCTIEKELNAKVLRLEQESKVTSIFLYNFSILYIACCMLLAKLLRCSCFSLDEITLHTSGNKAESSNPIIECNSSYKGIGT